MHLTCAGKSKEDLLSLLHAAKEAGVSSILALTGEAGPGDAPPSMKAVNLVRLAREHFGDFFTIAVGAYPDGWYAPGSERPPLDTAAEVAAVAEKVQAGADFVVTQFVFDATTTSAFIEALRAADVHAPVVPGVLAVDNPRLLKHMAEHCRVQLPEALQAVAEAVAMPGIDGDEGAGQGTTAHPVLSAASAQLAGTLLGQGACGVHFYTLNQEGPLQGVLESEAVKTALHAQGGAGVLRRKLPWRAPAGPTREGEAVRPIFWANRPQSYIQRTSSWSEFPTGRWSDVADPVPATTPLSGGGTPETGGTGHWGVSHAGLQSEGTGTATGLPPVPSVHSELGGWGDAADRRAMWGERLATEADVWSVFAGYVAGTVPRIPWCEAELHPETARLTQRLVSINRAGLLTINSQPALSEVPSDHPVHGWGGAGGLVYQKAYIEFFASPALLRAVMEVAARPAFASVRYMAVDARGNSYSNSTPGTATAVTWGVFPGREVVQPTVVDAEAFQVWKEEAFALWRDVWAAAYDEDSDSHALLHGIASKYYLVNVVDNDFMNEGGLWEYIHAVMLEAGSAGLDDISLAPAQLAPAGSAGAPTGSATPSTTTPAAVVAGEAAAVTAAALGFDSASATASLSGAVFGQPLPAASAIGSK